MDIKRGDIWYIESGYATVGSEQRPGRPAVVVSNDKNNEYSSTLEVIYLTTQPKHDLPTHVTIRSTNRESTALCEQITSVAVERFGDYCGHVTEHEMNRIETALLISLGLIVKEPVTEETPPHDCKRFCESGCGRSKMRYAARNVRCSVRQAHQSELGR